ncbi:response regulator, partial [bacterium]|nr:response regulator [bacterium]
SLIEHIMAPLEHVLRNAVDHGIESVEERHKAGKPEAGSISLNVFREGGEVVIELQDDGKGVNVEAVRKKAIAKGLLDKKASLSDNEIIQFIFASGFSTAESVTKLSGRGVGMDVVQSEVKAIGGSVEISSVSGKGTTIRFRLPFTVSMSRALLVSAGGERLAVPLDNVEGIVRVSPYELEEFYSDNAPMFEYAGQKYEFKYLGSLINGSQYASGGDMSTHLPVLLVRSGDQLAALQVDKLLGSREIVVKSLGTMFSKLEGVAGATVLGDGSVVVIADLIGLVRAEHMHMVAANDDLAARTPGQITAMVVDDSVTVRKVTTRMLERFGMEVVTAKDGVEAMQMLEDTKPDFMLLDIEMPRMDGFEVASRVRRSDELGDVPIIMITSRTGSKHRERALSLGVNHYLGKPYQEAVLLKSIEEVLGNKVQLTA